MVTFDRFISSWTWDPLVAIALGIALGLYLRGVQRLHLRGCFSRGLSWKRTLFYPAGLLVLFVALDSAIDVYADSLLAFHMIQHLLLTMVAAPLLLLGRPLTVILGALPNRPLQAALKASLVRSALRFIGRPAVAWLIGTLVFWVWHFPPLYDAALRSYWLHSLEHFSFLAAGLLWWWPVVIYPARGFPYPLRLLYIFAGLILNSWLGAMIVLSGERWYSFYDTTTALWGLTPLDDQRLAGLIMWVPGGAIHLLAMTVVFFAWMGTGEEEEPVETRPAE